MQIVISVSIKHAFTKKSSVGKVFRVGSFSCIDLSYDYLLLVSQFCCCKFLPLLSTHFPSQWSNYCFQTKICKANIYYIPSTPPQHGIYYFSFFSQFSVPYLRFECFNPVIILPSLFQISKICIFLYLSFLLVLLVLIHISPSLW